MRDAGRVRRAGGAQGCQVGKTPGFRIRAEPDAKLGFATAPVAGRQECDHDTACLPFGTKLQKSVEGVAGEARAKLLPRAVRTSIWRSFRADCSVPVFRPRFMTSFFGPA